MNVDINKILSTIYVLDKCDMYSLQIVKECIKSHDLKLVSHIRDTMYFECDCGFELSADLMYSTLNKRLAKKYFMSCSEVMIKNILK